MSAPPPSAAVRLRRLLGFGPVLIGGPVLLGWVLDLPALKTVLPGLTTMKANTALGLLAAGAGVLLLPARPGVAATRWRPLAAAAAGAVALLLGALTLAEYLSGAHLGLDELLFADPNTTSPPYPGRMSPATAAALACAGAAVLLLARASNPSGAADRGRYHCTAAAHLLAAVPAGVGYLSLAGYAYRVEGLYSFGAFVTVAVHTAVGLALLAPALLLTLPDLGWRRAFADHPVARGALARLLPLSLLLPFLAGLAVVWGARARVYDPLYGPALFALVAAVASMSLAWGAAMTVRRAEAALRAGEARLRHTVEMNPQIPWTADPRGGITGFSRRWLDVTGLTRDAALGEGWMQVPHPDDRGRMAASWRHAVATGAPYDVEVRLRMADGSYRWWRARATARRDDTGAVVEWHGQTEDIHERKQAEERLRESEARFRHMADSAPSLIWMSDERGQLVFANMHYEHLFGRPAAAMLGQGWERDVLAEDLPGYREAFRGAFHARLGFRAEARVRDRDGQVRWLRCEAVPRLDDAGIFLGYTGCAVDVTDAKLAAETLEARVAERTVELRRAVDALRVEALERERAEAALRQAQKMEAVGQLTGGIAHDFNNMLQAIGGSLEMVQRRVVQGRAADADRYAEGARATVERAAALTHRLLAFARRQALRPEPVEPDELVEGMAELIRRTVGPAVAVELSLHDGVWTVLCDPNQLENVLLNLAINARDAMAEGGRLTIRTADVSLRDAEVAGQDGAMPGDYVEIAVTDTGSGMDEATRARAFEPFFTTKPIGQGTGLGLSQLYGFVRQSGGFVRLDSAPGRGTTVRLYLPRHADAGNEAEPATGPGREAAAPPWAGRGEAVLLVEDEAGVRAVAAERLRERGYTVLEAEDGSAALRLLRSGVHVDLLVTDVGLPGGMNGRQVAEAARERRPDLPVLFITGYAGGALQEQLAPGMAVIGKPFALDALAERIRAMLEAAPAE